MTEKEIVIELHKSGFRPFEISRKVYMTTQQIRDMLIAAGRSLDERGAKPGSSGSKPRLHKHVPELFNMCFGGMSASEAMSKIGINANPEYIAKLVRKHGRDNGVKIECRR